MNLNSAEAQKRNGWDLTNLNIRLFVRNSFLRKKLFIFFSMKIMIYLMAYILNFFLRIQLFFKNYIVFPFDIFLQKLLSDFYQRCIAAYNSVLLWICLLNGLSKEDENSFVYNAQYIYTRFKYHEPYRWKPDLHWFSQFDHVMIIWRLLSRL